MQTQKKIFGFYEPPRPGQDPQFWHDHGKSQRICHDFLLVNADRLKWLPHYNFEGVARVRERLSPTTSRGISREVIYEVYHDVWAWDAGRFVCGAHGEDCPATDLAARWRETKGRITRLVYYPLVTPDGRIFKTGVNQTDASEVFMLNFE